MIKIKMENYNWKISWRFCCHKIIL